MQICHQRTEAHVVIMTHCTQNGNAWIRTDVIQMHENT